MEGQRKKSRKKKNRSPEQVQKRQMLLEEIESILESSRRGPELEILLEQLVLLDTLRKKSTAQRHMAALNGLFPDTGFLSFLLCCDEAEMADLYFSLRNEAESFPEEADGLDELCRSIQDFCRVLLKHELLGQDAYEYVLTIQPDLQALRKKRFCCKKMDFTAEIQDEPVGIEADDLPE